MIIRSAGKDFFPRLRVCRLKIMTIRHLFDFFRGESREKFPGQHTEKGVAQTIDPFEVLE
jgi:hypothetical protein